MNRTKSNNQFLSDRADMLTQVIRAIGMTIDGAYFTGACRKCGLDPQRVTTLLNGRSLGMIRLDGVALESGNAALLQKDPYEVLYGEVFGHDKENLVLPYDVEATVDHVFMELSDRERRVLTARYGLDGEEPVFLEALGRELGVTRERVRQLETKAIRRLRLPRRANLLLKGIAVHTAEQKALEETHQALLTSITDAANERNTSFKNVLDSVCKDEGTSTAAKESIGAHFAKMPLQDTDLSVRSFNCLIRSGCRTAFDMLLKTDDDLMRTRNLGRRSMQEICDKSDQLLAPYGMTREMFRREWKDYEPTCD